MKQARLIQRAIDSNFWVKKFKIQAFYDLNIFCLTFYKGPGKQFYTPLTEKLTLRAVIFFGQRIHFWGKKYRLSLLDGFRQISFYLPEEFRQISFYSIKFRQIASSKRERSNLSYWIQQCKDLKSMNLKDSGISYTIHMLYLICQRFLRPLPAGQWSS